MAKPETWAFSCGMFSAFFIDDLIRWWPRTAALYFVLAVFSLVKLGLSEGAAVKDGQ